MTAALLEDARRRGLFSAAAWSVGGPDGPLERGRLGTRAIGGAPLDGDDLWDLASVTKPLVGLAVMALAERGTLTLDDRTGDLLPDFAATNKAELTVRHLLAHTSGLPGQVPLYREHPTRERLLEALRTLPPRAAPGERVEYTSQGFMLLGLLAEAASGQSLAKLVEDTVAAPLGLRGLGFTPDAGSRAVATEDCPWRGRVVSGEVHDENAVVLGGVAGHAGLFATLADLERLGACLAAGGTELLSADTFAEMTACQTEGLNLRRALAWQMVDPAGSPVGTRPGPDSYGHTGFTGTSLWVSPSRRRYAVLLTNRVHPTRAERGFGAVRKAFHDRAF
jgi:CubicO group peptidase (beta-lactamase class C family)